MAATAAGGFRRFLGTGKSLSFVRPHHMLRATVALSLLYIGVAHAEPQDFSGRWYLDLRTPSQRAKSVECGGAEFQLAQSGDRITGSHSMATAGCGRVNEGGPETVKGVVVNGTAVLVVTSGRNGAMVVGKARVRQGKLHWQSLEEVRAGEPDGDSPLILEAGVLNREFK